MVFRTRIDRAERHPGMKETCHVCTVWNLSLLQCFSVDLSHFQRLIRENGERCPLFFHLLKNACLVRASPGVYQVRTNTTTH